MDQGVIMTKMVSSWIGTSNRGYSAYAMEELRRMFTNIRFQPIVPSEVNLLTIPLSYEEVIEQLIEHEPIFLLHIHPVQFQGKIDGSEQDLEQIAEHLKSVSELWDQYLTPIHKDSHPHLAIQVRKREGLSLSYSPLDMKQAIASIFAQDYNCEIVTREADWILSVYLAGSTAYIGMSRPQWNLSDWAGGAMRFVREEGQVSRAQFKLLEAERKFSLDLGRFHRALDIGAAPGGWTSLLLDRGLHVTAVDPAELDTRVLRRVQLRYLKKTADQVSFEPDHFDLLVCDMSWDPQQMSRQIVGLLYAVQAGGTVILTLKLMHGKPFRQINETVHAFQNELRLVIAKQLFHNRQELTLYFVKEKQG